VGAVFELPGCAAVPLTFPVVCTLPQCVTRPCGEADSAGLVPGGEDPEFGDEVCEEVFPVVVVGEFGVVGNVSAEGFGVLDSVEA
jgi:hypothetical protein